MGGAPSIASGCKQGADAEGARRPWNSRMSPSLDVDAAALELWGELVLDVA